MLKQINYALAILLSVYAQQTLCTEIITRPDRVLRIPGHGTPNRVAVTPDGQNIFVATRQGKVYRWNDNPDNEPELLFQDTTTNPREACVAYNDYSKKIIVKRRNGNFYVGNNERTSIPWEIHVSGIEASSCAVSADGNYIIAGDHAAHLYDLTRNLHMLTSVGDNAVAIGPDNNTIACTNHDGLSLYNIEHANWPFSVGFNEEDVKCRVYCQSDCNVDISPDGKIIAVSSGEGNIHLLTLNGLQKVKNFRAKPPSHGFASNILFGGDNIVYATLHSDLATEGTGDVQVWDLRNTRMPTTLLKGEAYRCDLAYARSSGTIVSGARGTEFVRVWNMRY